MRGRRDTDSILVTVSTALLACAVLVVSVPVVTVVTENVLMQREQETTQRQWWQGGRSATGAVAQTPFLLEIPKIGLRWLIREGTGIPAMRRYGAGHIPGTALPGQPGMVGIAGHRTTYGAPFFHVNLLGAGDQIVVRTPAGSLTYRVLSSTRVAPAAVDILQARTPGSFLVLISCSPLYSAAYRLAVFAVLERAQPGRAARVPPTMEVL